MPNSRRKGKGGELEVAGIYSFVVYGLLPNLNDYIKAERRNRFEAAAMKRKTQAAVLAAIHRSLRGAKITRPVILHYLWVERDRRRDKDNVAFAQKFVQDALVQAGVLRNDGWSNVEGFTHAFAVDKAHPRVEVRIEVL